MFSDNEYWLNGCGFWYNLFISLSNKLSLKGSLKQSRACHKKVNNANIANIISQLDSFVLYVLTLFTYIDDMALQVVVAAIYYSFLVNGIR